MATSDRLISAATDPPRASNPDQWDLVLKCVILMSLAALAAFCIHNRVFSPVVQLAEADRISAFCYRPSIVWFSMGFLLAVFRTFLWFRYRPHPHAPIDQAPRMTVVIPAYNEGAMVANSINSVANARYDPDQLEIIVVDDGSTDDTWQHIEREAGHHGNRIRTLRLACNQGKRGALATGFRMGSGEIFVTVDSDSVIDPGALLALAGPFRNQRVGIVAGKVQVYNRREGFIPRMLHVRFTLSFDFLRAYQSTFGTVYCSPGALSAYRASAVRAVVDKWETQSFLGAEVKTGEDRALTNDIMRLGYDSVYQQDARVLTVVPSDYRTLCRMFLRWDRSYIREEFRFAAIMWKRPPLALTIAFFDYVVTNLRFPVFTASFVWLAAALFYDPLMLPRLMLSIGAISFIYSLYYLRSERSMDIIYGVFFEYFSFFSMFWIFPWALLTVRSKSWLTR